MMMVTRRGGGGGGEDVAGRRARDVNSRRAAASGVKWQCDDHFFIGNLRRRDAIKRLFFSIKAHGKLHSEKEAALLLLNGRCDRESVASAPGVGGGKSCTAD